MKKIGLNGGIVDAADAVVPVMDHGFLYGMGLFETLRTYRGRPFLLERHLKRMAEGCRMLGIPFSPEDALASMPGWIEALMKANGLEEAYIRYTVSAGVDVLGLPGEEYSRPNHVLLVKALPEATETLYTQGKALQLLETRRNSPEAPIRLKSLHYMNNILAKRELAALSDPRSRQAEGLMLDERGHVSEGVVSNVFFVKEGELYTPDASTGLLPGITRQVVLELAGAAGIRCTEGLYTWEDLLDADEVFVTSSIQELVPVTLLLDRQGTGRTVSHGAAGPITRRLLDSYRQKAGI